MTSSIVRLVPKFACCKRREGRGDGKRLEGSGGGGGGDDDGGRGSFGDDNNNSGGGEDDNGSGGVGGDHDNGGVVVMMVVVVVVSMIALAEVVNNLLDPGEHPRKKTPSISIPGTFSNN